jgi:hypothetical protein
MTRKDEAQPEKQFNKSKWILFQLKAWLHGEQERQTRPLMDRYTQIDLTLEKIKELENDQETERGVGSD